MDLLQVFSIEPQATNEPPFLADRITGYRRRVEANTSHLLQSRQPLVNDILLVSNDYLAIAQHPDIINAKAQAIETVGHGLLRSDVFRSGDHPLGNFEQAIAAWAGSEAALVSQSGWCANMGLVQSVANPDTPVYLDMFAHMSMWEGARSAGATVHPFRHNDAASLEKIIHRHGMGVVIIETVYSTSGSVAPLRDMAEVCEQNGCLLIVDESHSLGLFGTTGEGMVAAAGLTHQVHFRTASLSKAFAARGGLILGSFKALEYIRYESLPAIFSSGVQSYEAAGFAQTLEVIKGAKTARVKLQANADYLRLHLDALGYNVSASQSQIVSLESGPEQNTVDLRDALESRGIFGSVFCWPATAKDRSLVRFSVNAGLETAQLERVIAVCAEIRDVVDYASWPSTRRKPNGAARTRKLARA